MIEINELIASEIADFFTGFGGPGEPDIQTGEAQRLLTERLVSVLALRERAEPVYQVQAMDWHDVEKYLYDEALDRGIRCRVLYTAPPAPVVPRPVSQPYKLPEWTNEQCLEFLAVAFRHAEINGDIELDDLRLGVKMANEMTPVEGGLDDNQ
ncbi:hypothetical protein SMC38_002360 [Cronobacter sakazakii]|nr:hypothetical protein [Cronobacter sakazakii]